MSGGDTGPAGGQGPAPLQVEFCGEWFPVDPADGFVVGRGGALEIEDNPYLHRAFLEIRWEQAWWVTNVGTRLTATVTDGDGTMQAWLAPGGMLPLVFRCTEVRFSAGATTYCVALHLSDAPISLSSTTLVNGGTTTLHPVLLTDKQRLLILSLAEPTLRSRGGTSTIPSSAEAARRLGWPLTAFNRQLDHVCQKLAKTGVQGLHGDLGKLASGRRARLVEYSLAVRLITADDLPLLDLPESAGGDAEPS